MGERIRNGYIFDEYRLDSEERTLFRDDGLVVVSPRAVDTLLVLLEHRGHVVSKEELLRTVWADAYVEENNLNQAISALRRTFGERSYIETIPRRGYRFVGPVTEARGERRPHESTISVAATAFEAAGGALALDSPFYVERPVDAALRSAVARRDSIVLVKGARQMGKTSLLARGLQEARNARVRVVLTDMQDLDSSDLESSESLFTALGRELEESLELDASLRSSWDAGDSPNRNFGRYVRRFALAGEVPLVWGLDEVDRLFGRSYSDDVFGLFRSWHNRRALDPAGPWNRLTLVMAYATEAHLFIADVNQSPFNVGTRLGLRDFVPDEVAELDDRYGAPLGRQRLGAFFDLLAGQPYLVQRGLQTLAAGVDYDTFTSEAALDRGPYGDHLRRIGALLASDDELANAVRSVLARTRGLEEGVFYRLRAAGILSGDTAHDAALRCKLYESYLEAHLG